MDALGKSRIDAWYAELDERARWEIYDYFCAHNWRQTAEHIETEHGVEAPSRSALYRFADRMRELSAESRLASAIKAREEAGALAAARTDDATTVEAFKTLAQDAALTGNPELAESYARIACRLADGAVKKADLQLRRDKFEAAERRLAATENAVKDETVSPEERLAKIKEIFGLK